MRQEIFWFINIGIGALLAFALRYRIVLHAARRGRRVDGNHPSAGVRGRSLDRDRLNSLERDFAPHVPELRSWLGGQLRNGSDIDDVIQDIWVRLCGRDPSQPSIENVRSYMFQTARSVLADRHRRASVRMVDRHLELTEFDHPVEEVTPERVIMGKQQIVTVSQRIAMLPERTRDIFLLNRFDQMSYRDIARAMNLSVSAVEKHMMKALRFLMNDEDGADG